MQEGIAYLGSYRKCWHLLLLLLLLLVCYGRAYNLNVSVKICAVQYYTNN